MGNQMIEDEVMVLLIFADDCLDVKVNILWEMYNNN